MIKDGIIYIDHICKNQLYVGAIFNLKDEIHIKRKGNKTRLIISKFGSRSTSANEMIKLKAH